MRYDASSQKWRETNEPHQWPDQYIHHALIQALMPTLMRGMDNFCCGSIRGRGGEQVRKSIAKWMKDDVKGTKYCLQCDIRHFYPNLKPNVVMNRMRELIKDGRALDLIERTLVNGVKIGAFTSQWFANTTLQPLDHLIREGGFGVTHYVRYMDNFTVFCGNKRKLHKLREAVGEWLKAHKLELKDDWQIYRTAKNIAGKHRRHQCGRLPQAVGYRFGRGYILPRKRNFFRLKKSVGKYRRRTARGLATHFRVASGLISRLGQLTHCNNVKHYKRILNGEKLQRAMKVIVRSETPREWLSWREYMIRRQAA